MSARILIIEDDEAILKFLRRGLAYEGYTVDTANDGQSGLILARDNPPDLVVLDLRKAASFTEYFLICTGASTRQVQAISNAVEEALLKNGKRPGHIEGYSSAEWILLDYGDFIVHVFGPASRRFYDLERLWRDAPRVEAGGDE